MILRTLVLLIVMLYVTTGERDSTEATPAPQNVVLFLASATPRKTHKHVFTDHFEHSKPPYFQFSLKFTLEGYLQISNQHLGRPSEVCDFYTEALRLGVKHLNASLHEYNFTTNTVSSDNFLEDRPVLRPGRVTTGNNVDEGKHTPNGPMLTKDEMKSQTEREDYPTMDNTMIMGRDIFYFIRKAQLQKRDNFLLMVTGGALYISDDLPEDDLNWQLSFAVEGVLGEINSTNTLVVVMGVPQCDQYEDMNEIPLYAQGPGSEVLRTATYAWEVPLLIEAAVAEAFSLQGHENKADHAGEENPLLKRIIDMSSKLLLDVTEKMREETSAHHSTETSVPTTEEDILNLKIHESSLLRKWNEVKNDNISDNSKPAINKSTKNETAHLATNQDSSSAVFQNFQTHSIASQNATPKKEDHNISSPHIVINVTNGTELKEQKESTISKLVETKNAFSESGILKTISLQKLYSLKENIKKINSNGPSSQFSSGAFSPIKRNNHLNVNYSPLSSLSSRIPNAQFLNLTNHRISSRNSSRIEDRNENDSKVSVNIEKNGYVNSKDESITKRHLPDKSNSSEQNVFNHYRLSPNAKTFNSKLNSEHEILFKKVLAINRENYSTDTKNGNYGTDINNDLHTGTDSSDVRLLERPNDKNLSNTSRSNIVSKVPYSEEDNITAAHKLDSLSAASEGGKGEGTTRNNTTQTEEDNSKKKETQSEVAASSKEDKKIKNGSNVGKGITMNFPNDVLSNERLALEAEQHRNEWDLSISNNNKSNSNTAKILEVRKIIQELRSHEYPSIINETLIRERKANNRKLRNSNIFRRSKKGTNTCNCKDKSVCGILHHHMGSKDKNNSVRYDSQGNKIPLENISLNDKNSGEYSSIHNLDKLHDDIIMSPYEMLALAFGAPNTNSALHRISKRDGPQDNEYLEKDFPLNSYAMENGPINEGDTKNDNGPTKKNMSRGEAKEKDSSNISSNGSSVNGIINKNISLEETKEDGPSKKEGTVYYASQTSSNSSYVNGTINKNTSIGETKENAPSNEDGTKYSPQISNNRSIVKGGINKKSIEETKIKGPSNKEEAEYASQTSSNNSSKTEVDRLALEAEQHRDEWDLSISKNNKSNSNTAKSLEVRKIIQELRSHEYPSIINQTLIRERKANNRKLRNSNIFRRSKKGTNTCNCKDKSVCGILHHHMGSKDKNNSVRYDSQGNKIPLEKISLNDKNSGEYSSIHNLDKLHDDVIMSPYEMLALAFGAPNTNSALHRISKRDGPQDIEYVEKDFPLNSYAMENGSINEGDKKNDNGPTKKNMSRGEAKEKDSSNKEGTENYLHSSSNGSSVNGVINKNISLEETKEDGPSNKEGTVYYASQTSSNSSFVNGTINKNTSIGETKGNAPSNEDGTKYSPQISSNRTIVKDTINEKSIEETKVKGPSNKEDAEYASQTSSINSSMTEVDYEAVPKPYTISHYDVENNSEYFLTGSTLDDNRAIHYPKPVQIAMTELPVINNHDNKTLTESTNDSKGNLEVKIQAQNMNKSSPHAQISNSTAEIIKKKLLLSKGYLRDMYELLNQNDIKQLLSRGKENMVNASSSSLIDDKSPFEVMTAINDRNSAECLVPTGMMIIFGSAFFSC